MLRSWAVFCIVGYVSNALKRIVVLLSSGAVWSANILLSYSY